MTNLSFYKKSIILLILPLILVMCMTIESITHPDNPQVNSEIEIGVKVKLEPANDDNTKMVFAVLAPQSWNITNNAVLTFSTNGYTKGDVTDEQMTLVAETETEPTTNLAWSTALENQLGLMGNLGPVEWVVFESQTTFDITDEEEELITADINIKLTTGSENIKVVMGYFFCGKNNGFNGDFYRANAKSKVLRISGGSNPLIDYTTDAEPTTGAITDYSVFTVQNASSEYFMGTAGDILFNEKYKENAQITQQEAGIDYENLPDKWVRWYFIYNKTEGGMKYYQLMNAMSGKYLTVSEGEQVEGLPIKQLSALPEAQEDRQLWEISEIENGQYKISNKGSGLALTVAGNQAGDVLTQAAYTGSGLQLWKLYHYDLCSYRDDEVVHFFERNDKDGGSSAFDQGSSIPLADGRILWITQDAWDGWQLTANNMFHSNHFFSYGNSMFLQPSKSNWNPDDAPNITRENSAQNRPRQICDIQPNQTFAWPSNGVELNGRVYLNCGEGTGLAAEGQSVYELWPKQEGSLVWNSVRHTIPAISAYNEITYASGMVKADDGFVYNFGAKVDLTHFRLYVARFAENDPLDNWAFWNGTDWVNQPPAGDEELEAAKIFEGQGASVAVSLVHGKYVVMSLDQGFWETSEHFIRIATSDSPTGDFTAQKQVYDICENIYGKQARYYTPNIHPVFENGRNELLVTYSLNFSANEDQDITCNENGEKIVDGNTITNGDYIDPYFYRVKGVRIPYSLIGIEAEDIPSSVETSLRIDRDIEIYPNPVANELYLKSVSDLHEKTFRIYNVTGNLVKTGKITGNKINTRFLAKGIYLLNIGDEGFGTVRKFIKRNNR